jgi:hypothetical protein
MAAIAACLPSAFPADQNCGEGRSFNAKTQRRKVCLSTFAPLRLRVFALNGCEKRVPSAKKHREIAIVGKADPKTERRFARWGLAVASTQMI